MSLLNIRLETIQLQYGKPIPYELVRKIAEFRAAENRKKAEDKLKRRNDFMK